MALHDYLFLSSPLVNYFDAPPSGNILHLNFEIIFFWAYLKKKYLNNHCTFKSLKSK